MNRVVLSAILLLAALVAGFAYFRLSRILLAAVVCCLWLALTVVLSFAGDRRYVRAYGGDASGRSLDLCPPPRLSIGRAILFGELIVNVPAVGLLIGVTAGVGSLLEYVTGHNGVARSPTFITIVAIALAFIASWLWWSIASPRWLLWAMKRVADPIALKRAAVGSILCPEGKWGRLANRAQWRSAAMESEERDIIQQAMTCEMRRGQAPQKSE